MLEEDDHLRYVSGKEIFKAHVFRIDICSLDQKHPPPKAKFRQAFNNYRRVLKAKK